MLRAQIEVFKGAVWGGQPDQKVTSPQTNEQARELFLKGMLDMPSQRRQRNPAEWVLSILVHVVVLGSLLVAPLFFTHVIDLSHFDQTVLVAPDPPAAPPPPVKVQTVKVVKATARPIPQQFTIPQAIPAKIRMVKDSVPPPDVSVGGVPRGVPGGVPGGVLGGIVGGSGGIPKLRRPRAAANKILLVGGDVKRPRRIYAPPPVYPALAKASDAQGVVVIEAVIDGTGKVVQARAIKGPSLLVRAALEAVAKWRYEPTYVDGHAVSIRMHLTVTFTLN